MEPLFLLWRLPRIAPLAPRALLHQGHQVVRAVQREVHSRWFRVMALAGTTLATTRHVQVVRGALAVPATESGALEKVFTVRKLTALQRL